MLGKVHGPYKGRTGKQYIVIMKYNNEGRMVDKKTILYKLYLDECNKGLHKYTDPPKKISFIPKIYSTKETRCIYCNKNFITKKYKEDKYIYFCSRKCRNKYKKKKAKIIYDHQIVIPIKGNQENYFIIIEKNTSKKIPIFIKQNKCTYEIKEDHNGIMLIKIVYDIKDSVKIKSVLGFKKFFWVSEDGILVSRRTKKILSQTLSETGYWTHATKIGGRNGRAICFKIHRLVAEVFVPNLNNKPFVNHINGIKTDNRYTNLEWCTAQENTIHAHSIGLIKHVEGENVGSSKLTNNDAIIIRDLYNTGNKSLEDLAVLYNVVKLTIKNCVDKVTFKHI